jgi:DNA-binding XRE family transcriptional regulator
MNVQGPQVRLGVVAPAGLCLRRDEWLPDPAGAEARHADRPRRVLARKLKVLRFLCRYTPESLAAAAGVPVARVLAAEGTDGAPDLDDLDKLARALGVKVAELFRPAGRTAEERVLLAMLEGEGE